jgi:signal transduction histidine kinase
VDAEIDTREVTPRNRVRTGGLRPSTGLGHALSHLSFATRLYVLATTLLIAWTLVLVVLIALNKDLRSTTILATSLLLTGVSTLLVAAGMFAVFPSATNRLVASNAIPETAPDGDRSNGFAFEPAREHISGMADTFQKMTDQLDDATLTVNYLEGIISSLSVGLLVIDESGCVRMANQVFRTMARCLPEAESGDQLIGTHITALFVQEAGTNHILSEAGDKNIETTLKLRDGNVLPVMLVSTVLPESESIKGAVCTINALSERKLTENYVRAGRERVESLVQHLHEIQEKERSRIARDLHDDLGAFLTALRNGLVRLGGQIEGGASSAVDDLVDLADTANISVDRVIRNLWPQVLDHFGLGGALEVLAAEFETTHGIATTFSLDTEHARFDRSVELALYRTSQEALTNIAKHSHARGAQISLSHKNCEIVLEISDDGHGFAKRNRRDREGSYGLLGMRQRIAAVSGKLSVETGSEGSTIIAKVPQASNDARILARAFSRAPKGTTNDQSTAG